MKEHYYLVIEQQISEIVKALSPKTAPDAVAQNRYLQGQWHVRKGMADHHYIGYEFHPSGRSTARQVDIVDLGPTNAYDAPGLPRERMTGDCGQLRDCDNCSIAERLEDAEDLLSIADRADEPVVPFAPVDEPATPHPDCAHCPPLEGYEALIEHHDRHHASD